MTDRPDPGLAATTTPEQGWGAPDARLSSAGRRWSSPARAGSWGLEDEVVVR